MDKKTLIIIIEGIALLLVLGIVWGVFRSKLNVSDQNLKAARGEIELLESKNNELIYSRDSYILQKNDLELQLGITKKEVKELEKKLNGTLTYISELEGKIVIKEIVTVRDSIIYKTPNNALSHFRYNDKWVTINGTNDIFFENNKIREITTVLDSLSMGVDLQVGLVNNNKIFVKTDNPYITFNSIEGAYLDKKISNTKRVKFTWGFQVGFGVNYGLVNKAVDVGPYGGFGIGMSF